MSHKFDRYTRSARRVITLAVEEAQRLNHNDIGAEHLLLGLIREENTAVRVLHELGVENLEQVRVQIESRIGRGQRAVYGKLSLTPGSKRMIELAVDEARRLGNHYIGTEHLLLGLVRCGEGVGVNVLKEMGVSLEEARSQTARMRMESSPQATTHQASSQATTIKAGPIFISYNHRDSNYARLLAEALENSGFEVWIDERIDYGTQWPRVIQENLDKCRAFIVIMTSNSFHSDWVQSELSRAKRKGKIIFPLLLEGNEPWLSVESTQYVDVRDGKLPPRRFFELVLKMLQSRANRYS